jgi:hypothetical protein
VRAILNLRGLPTADFEVALRDCWQNESHYRAGRYSGSKKWQREYEGSEEHLMKRQTGLIFRPMDLCESADRQEEGTVVGGKRAQRDRQKRFLLLEPVFGEQGVVG